MITRTPEVFAVECDAEAKDGRCPASYVTLNARAQSDQEVLRMAGWSEAREGHYCPHHQALTAAINAQITRNPEVTRWL